MRAVNGIFDKAESDGGTCRATRLMDPQETSIKYGIACSPMTTARRARAAKANG